MDTLALRPTRFLINAAVLLVPLFVLVLGARNLVWRVVNYLSSNGVLARVVSTEASRALSREVYVADIKIGGNLWSLVTHNTVDLVGVKVSESGPHAHSPFASADRVVLHYTLNDILYGDSRTPYVSDVHLVRPQLHISRDNKGAWNFADLTKPKAAAGRIFTDKISVSDGTFVLDDQRFPSPSGNPTKPLIASVQQVTGTALIRDDKSVGFDFSGKPDRSVAAGFHVVGVFQPLPIRVAARIQVQAVNLVDLCVRMVPASKLRCQSGVADVDLRAVYFQNAANPTNPSSIGSGSLSVNGSTEITGAEISSSYLRAPLKALAGKIAITDTSCSADASFAVDGVPLNIHASLSGLPRIDSLNRATEQYRAAFRADSANAPVVHLSTQIPNTELARLYRDFNIDQFIPEVPAVVRHDIDNCTALGSITMDLDGRVTNPTAVWSAHLLRARYGQVYGKNIDISATIRDRLLIGDIRGSYAGGDATIRTQVAIDPSGSFRVEARGRGLHLLSIGYPVKQLQDGSGDLDLAITGRRGRTPAITAQVQLNDVKLNDQVFHSAYAMAESAAHVLVLRTVRLDDVKGFLVGSGTVDLSSHVVNMNIEADGLDVRALVDALRPEPPLAADPSIPSLSNLDGVAYLRKGAISGTYDDPVLTGEASAFGVSTGKYAVDKAEAAFRLSRAGLIIGRGLVEKYPSSISFSGSIVDLQEPRPSLDFNVRAKDLDLSYLAELAGIDRQKTRIEGTVSTDGPEGIRVYGSASDIHAIGLTGLGDNQPFSVSLHRAAINGLRLQSAFAEAFFDGSGLHLSQAKIETAQGEISATGVVTLAGEVDANITGTRLNLGSLTSALPDATAPELGGQIGFAVHVEGSGKDLTAHAERISAEAITYRDFALGTLNTQADYSGGIVTFRNAALTDGATKSVFVTAPLLTYDTKSREFSSPDVSRPDSVKIVDLQMSKLGSFIHATQKAAPVRTLPVSLEEITGALNATVSFHGTLDEPAATVNLDSHNISIHDYLITSFTGSAAINRQGISGNSATLTIRPNVLPVELKDHPEKQVATVSMRDFKLLYGGDVKADIDITNVNLAFVQSAIDPTAIHNISGLGDKVGVLIAGTVQSPLVDFSVNLSNVTYMDRLFDRVELDHAHIEEGQIQVDDLRISKILSKSKTYQASVSGVVRGFTWTAPYLPETATLDVTAELPRRASQQERADLDLLTELGISAFKDSIGTFAGVFKVGGTIASPKLESGFLSLAADKIRLPGFQTGIVGLDTKVSISDDLVTVDKFTARTQVFDRKGQAVAKRISDPIQLTGSIPVGYSDAAPRTVAVPLTLHGENVYFDESPLPGSRSGKLNGSALLQVTMTRSLLRPTIGGSITITNTSANLPSDFAVPSGSSSPPVINPRFDLALNLSGKNVRLQNSQLDAQVGGVVNLRGDLASPIIHGKISLNQGTLKVPPRRFDIVPPGSIDIDYGNTSVGDASLNVRINLTARTKLTAVSVAGIRKLYTVTVTANGPLTETALDPGGQSRMHLDFNTDPNDLANSQQALSERLVTALFGVDTFNSVGHDPGQTAITALTSILTGSVLPEQFDKISSVLGLEQLAISYDPIEQLSVTLTRQLFGPLYVTYNRGLNTENRYYDVKMSLRFRERYQFSFDTDYQHIQKYLLEGVWRF